MSRGGRGGSSARGGGKRGPDMSWDDEVQNEPHPDTRKPQPLFPEDHYFPRPKPLTAKEKSHVEALSSFCERIYRGPLYTVLDPTMTASNAEEIESGHNRNSRDEASEPRRPNLRAGFDPFNDQEKYSTRYHPKKRTIPDLSQRSCYTLKLFPLELWSVIDPKRRMKRDWEGLTDEQKARLMPGKENRKRKRGQALRYEEDDGGAAHGRNLGSEADGSGSDKDDDEDIVSSSRRRRQKRAKEARPDRSSKQKRGLDAEDDFPDVDQADEDAEGGGGGGGDNGGAGEDRPHDSEFDTDEDDEEGMDDYNAEQYFDDGADDFEGGGDDDDDGGGGGGDTY